jgi:F-type H+-transporting ATPase subunit b
VLINGFTVFAQILNFLILVALLRWVLYKPIFKVLNQRQKGLEERWQEAEQLQTEAQQALLAYQQQQQDLADQRQSLLAAARAEAEQERQRQIIEIRQEAADQRADWRADLHQAQQAFLINLRQQVMQQTTAMARRALADLANADLERQMVAVFCDHLRHLPANQHQTLAQTLAEPMAVRSSFGLTTDLQQQVIDTLQATFGQVPPVEFATVPTLICGLELRLAGQEVVWSLDTYLTTLEQHLAAALTQTDLTEQPLAQPLANRGFATENPSQPPIANPP